MPIVVPCLDDGARRERIRLLKASIEELDGDIAIWNQIATTVQRRRDPPSESVERVGRCKLLCGILPLIRLKRPTNARSIPSSEQAVENAEKTLWSLRRERNEFERILRMYEAAALAPISSLPPEILETIFLHALPSKFPTPNISQAPINLTMVCHQWRALALATPGLWRSMSTTSDWPLRAFSPIPVEPNNPYLNDILTNKSLSMGRSNQPNVWIHRARSLSFHMEISIPHNDLWFGLRDPYRRWVLQTSCQWSHLRIESSAAGMAALLAGPLPKMQTLELIGRIPDHPFTNYSVCYADFDLKPENFHFPWNSLTTLDASSTWILLAHLLSVVHHAPVLRVCRAKVLLLDTAPLIIRPRGVYPNLVTLEIKFRCEYAFKAMIDYFTLPSLVSLHCCHLSPHDQSRWPESDMIAFAKRSQCPLVTLHAKGMWKDQDAAVSAAHAMQSTSQTLRDVDFSIL